MSDTDILKHLRRLTEEAQREADDQAERERAEQEAEARAIIDEIVPLAEAQARDGKSYAIIMDVTYSGRPRLFRDKVFDLDPADLTGASRIVWDYCEEHGLEPTLVGRWTQIRESLHRVDFSIVILW